MEVKRAILPPSRLNTSVVILAGGQGKRAGGCQKALLPYRGQPMLTHILQRLVPLGLPVWLNVQKEAYKAYSSYPLPLCFDEYQGFLGPMAGMDAAWKAVDSEWVAFIPCDNPSVSSTLIERLMSAFLADPAPLLVAWDGQRIQPLYTLMHCSLSNKLEVALNQSHLSVARWIVEQPHTLVDCSGEEGGFQNINRPEAL